MHRQLAREERTVLNRAFDGWRVFDFFKDKTVLIDDKGAVCLVSRALAQILEKPDPYFAGLVIGHLTKKKFTPSLQGADLFARVASRNRLYVTVNDAAEKLVLYGRDVLGESIVQADGMLDENELVIIMNRNMESIGIGRTRFAGKFLLQKGRATITTIADAGSYLRDETS